MIPWVREKFAERRGKWIASRKRNDVGASCSTENCNSQQAHTSQRIDEKQNSTSNLKEDSKDFNIKAKVNVRVLSPTGRATFIEIDKQMKMFELKHQALQKFSGDSGALPLFAQDIRQLYPKYRLIRPDATNTVNEAHSLLEAGVTDNETFILVVRRVTSSNNRIFEGPTIEDINRATRNIYSSSDRNNRADINELVLQSDLQFDVRKVIISLAQESAYVIGAGPYATRLIVMLKQKLVNKIKHQSDTLQCLVDMGFTEERAKYALKLHNGIYSSALEWLIEHQEGPIEDNSPQPSVQTTSSLKQLHPNNIVENIETLLEIVRIYSHRDVPPTPEMVQSLINMGFNEKEILTALRKTRNNQAAACEWLCGNRNNSLMELRDGLSKDSPILKTMMESPQVQMSLSNPKIFIAYLSMLDNQNALSMWLGDNDTSSIISHILRKYHEEKHVLGINQFNCVR